MPAYSASAKRGSYCGGMRLTPLVIELITTVSGSIEAQQVNPLATTRSTTSIAAVCNCATSSPAVASAAISRLAARACPSHMWPVCARFRLGAIPEKWGSRPSHEPIRTGW